MKNGKAYTYKIVPVAQNADVCSVPSYHFGGMHLSTPTVKATNVKGNKIKITWNKNTAANAYVVYYKLSTSKNYKSKVIHGNKNTKYTLTKLKKNKTYCIKVYSINTSAYDWSMGIYPESYPSKTLKVKVKK